MPTHRVTLLGVWLCSTRYDVTLREGALLDHIDLKHTNVRPPALLDPVTSLSGARVQRADTLVGRD